MAACAKDGGKKRMPTRRCNRTRGLGRPGVGIVRRAFVVTELGVVVAVLGVLCCAFAVGMGQSRKSAGLAGSLANLRKIGETTGMYSADFDEQAWSFSWSEGNYATDYEDLRGGGNLVAPMYQSVDIVRRLTGKDDHPRYDDRARPLYLGTLVLADYLGDSLPAEWSVSPGDRVRQLWAADPDTPPDVESWTPEFAATMGPSA